MGGFGGVLEGAGQILMAEFHPRLCQQILCPDLLFAHRVELVQTSAGGAIGGIDLQRFFEPCFGGGEIEESSFLVGLLDQNFDSGFFLLPPAQIAEIGTPFARPSILLVELEDAGRHRQRLIVFAGADQRLRALFHAANLRFPKLLDHRAEIEEEVFHARIAFRLFLGEKTAQHRV